jgi:hypothetical protein
VGVHACGTGSPVMAKGNWLFLHRSEEYIFYYRRAIPNSFRGMRIDLLRSLPFRGFRQGIRAQAWQGA